MKCPRFARFKSRGHAHIYGFIDTHARAQASIRQRQQFSASFHIALNSEFVIPTGKTNYRQTVERGRGPEICVTHVALDAHMPAEIPYTRRFRSLL